MSEQVKAIGEAVSRIECAPCDLERSLRCVRGRILVLQAMRNALPPAHHERARVGGEIARLEALLREAA